MSYYHVGLRSEFLGNTGDRAGPHTPVEAGAGLGTEAGAQRRKGALGKGEVRRTQVITAAELGTSSSVEAKIHSGMMAEQVMALSRLPLCRNPPPQPS